MPVPEHVRDKLAGISLKKNENRPEFVMPAQAGISLIP